MYWYGCVDESLCDWYGCVDESLCIGMGAWMNHCVLVWERG